MRLLDAYIGSLDLTGADLSNDAGPALTADGLQVDGDAALDGVKATGRGEDGAVRLLGAHITGQLQLTGELSNDAGPALTADHMQVDGGAALDGVKATGHGENGAVRLLDAHIGSLDLTGADLSNDAGPALAADGLQVDGGAFLDGVKATGRGENGAVRLLGAHITGQLQLTGELSNDAGPALHADYMQVDGGAFLDGVKATGHGENGAVRLLDAHIKGWLKVSGDVPTSTDGRVIVDLRNARVDGRITLWHKAFWQAAFAGPITQRPEMRLDGFTYRHQPYLPDAGDWLQVLIRCMPSYTPQPYRQLAKVYREAGDEQRAKEVLIAQQEHAFREALRHGGASRRGARAWHWINRATVQYGYRPSRALRFLLAVLAVTCVLMLFADTQGWLIRPKTRGGGRCSIVESIGSALDRTVPLLGFNVAGRCELTNATPAHRSQLILQVLSWAFVTLFIAGFTGIVRKPDS